MRAAILETPSPISTRPLKLLTLDPPAPTSPTSKEELLLRIRACGVCRTDLHIVEGELKPRVPRLIPGHQIVAEVISGPLAAGTRVGVSWLGGTDGTCPYCLRAEENLCDDPTFTGYTVNGGYAEFTTARADFVVPLPDALTDLEAAPLLCAGIIGFRSLRVAGVQPGERVGLFGFGASAHLDRIPEFDYDTLLWGERQIRSVANMTRADARDFLQLAAEIALKPRVTVFPLDQANEALAAVKNNAINGAAVIDP